MINSSPPEDQSSPPNDPVSAPAEHPFLPFIRNMVSEEAQKLMSTQNDGNKVSDTISKDWIEKIISSIDNKIEMEKVKTDSRFDRIMTESNAKFDKLITEFKLETEKNSLKMDAGLSKAETNITRWLAGIIIAVIFGTIGTFITVWKLNTPPTPHYEKNETSYTQPGKQEQNADVSNTTSTKKQ